MAEVAVHLDDVGVVALQRPAEAGDIGGAETLLARALQQVQRLGVFGLLLAYDGGSAVRRTVVDDEEMKSLRQGKDRIDHLRYVLTLIVGGYDD